ncbi:hypothetical protein [Vibrio cholerae]|uniref:hypothetical protein n=1 Tax=Vibrio cholerae TaxID=666 RepID=UPI0011D80376|nr:hypothetical protein [Vibrio cholerae]TXX49217.1 hypothetical protein FXF14_08360 [Vibrio cholerae]
MRIITIDESKIGKCIWCGEEFLKFRVNHQTCSDRCRKAHNRHDQALKRLAAEATEQQEEV